MKSYSFDFSTMASQQDFYRAFAETFGIAPERVDDLDSLWQVVTEEGLPLPLEIVFLHVTAEVKRRFGALILLFEEAEEELEGQLLFNIRQ
ncbi:barstar family protein [Cronobacter turicensis]|uniref:barstar family protein n=1 Tax=Cronobacter turicensis TaxID=413502 RepID=UPI0024AEEBAF|nr:hypothetical protein [Cronobacter turicensis]ELY4522904.1 hypothetical protein [Cronobacter turicensis]ELY4574109.1 hypothetical protein [Cronobacter turicensis]ELY4776516.1 hypothetical protein [Cronobacter turicensis]ELY4853856.1 hypothetical protein [Cronobacter turicensis]MDI7405748.1 hypothetical protein [Cronobacter turicensis]